MSLKNEYYVAEIDHERGMYINVHGHIVGAVEEAVKFKNTEAVKEWWKTKVPYSVQQLARKFTISIVRVQLRTTVENLGELN